MTIENKKLNLLVNIIAVNIIPKEQNEYFYFSPSLKELGTVSIEHSDAVKIETFPLFKSAQELLDILNKENIKISELNICS